jgi:hypothetical protein
MRAAPALAGASILNDQCGVRCPEPTSKESAMIREKQESAIKGMEQKKDTRVARASNRTIKKELEVEKPDPKRGRAARRLEAVNKG